MEWTGNIILNDNHKLEHISIRKTHVDHEIVPNGATLRFLSVVETCRIPLYLSVGPPCAVSTSNVDTERWFSQVLVGNETDADQTIEHAWWRSAKSDSPLGILVAVKAHGATSHLAKARVTEVLFYASRKANAIHAPPTPPQSSPLPGEAAVEAQHERYLQVSALLLSSDLLYHCSQGEPTPSSSLAHQDLEAAFISPSIPAEFEIINEPPVRKRRTANDALDDAHERRKKVRRKGGEGVAAAAAPKFDNQILSLQHHRSTSTTHSVPLQSRPLSRSPSIASSRPTTASRPSTLSKVESIEALAGGSNVENKNKDIISRIVMTGMRLYGLTQSKNRKGRSSSLGPPPAARESFDSIEAERRNDEEYKLIYHQVFKGTCLAFRATIGRENLQLFSAQVRDVVDQLLVIFCTDPLTNGLGKSDDKLTPGGRKAFRAAGVQENNSPFHSAVP